MRGLDVHENIDVLLFTVILLLQQQLIIIVSFHLMFRFTSA